MVPRQILAAFFKLGFGKGESPFHGFDFVHESVLSGLRLLFHGSIDGFHLLLDPGTCLGEDSGDRLLQLCSICARGFDAVIELLKPGSEGFVDSLHPGREAFLRFRETLFGKFS